MQDVFFILSKVVWTFLSPSALFVWLVLLASLLLWLNYIAAAKKLFLLLSLIGFCLLAYPVSDWLMYPLETRFQQPRPLPDSIAGIIVLGGAENHQLSDSWQAAQTGESAERILTAAALARVYADVPVIYSGGSNSVQRPNLDTEGNTARTLLQQAGIAENRIIIEPAARNTYENFVRLKKILSVPAGRYLLVTSAFHMPRAVGVARQQHVDVLPYPVDYRSNPPAARYWDFDLFAHLRVLEVAWHEWLGLAVYYVTGKTDSWFPQPEQTSEQDKL